MKNFLRIPVTMICAMAVLSCSACNLLPTKKSTSSIHSSQGLTSSEPISEPITELNQLYKGSDMHATVYDLKTFTSAELKEKNQVLIIMGIEIENVSSTQGYVLTTEAYDVYIDDVVVTTKDDLIGTNIYIGSDYLAPGKRAKGYWGTRIPADTKSIEVYVYENGISPDKYAVFNFDVPPVETMTLEKYAASIK